MTWNLNKFYWATAKGKCAHEVSGCPAIRDKATYKIKGSQVEKRGLKHCKRCQRVF